MTYDKAKYHLDGNFPQELPANQAYVHEGMFLGWATKKGLIHSEFREDFQDEVAQFLRRELSPGRFFRLVGGVLADDMLSDGCNAFAADYYAGRKAYFDDYAATFTDYPTLYHVPDTWANFERISERLDQRFEEWLS